MSNLSKNNVSWRAYFVANEQKHAGQSNKIFQIGWKYVFKKVKKHGEDVKNSCADNSPGSQKN